MTKRGKKARTKWRRLISEQARSGQTVTAFCRERSLCRPYFFAWKKRLREDTAVKFLEVQLTEAAPKAAGDSRVEIRLQNGRSLWWGAGAMPSMCGRYWRWWRQRRDRAAESAGDGPRAGNADLAGE